MHVIMHMCYICSLAHVHMYCVTDAMHYTSLQSLLVCLNGVDCVADRVERKQSLFQACCKVAVQDKTAHLLQTLLNTHHECLLLQHDFEC